MKRTRKMDKSKAPVPVYFRGYTKKEDGLWVSVCIDLNIVAQGSTSKEAFKNCVEAMSDYIDYVCSTYPEKIDQYLNQPAPREFFDEYFRIMRETLESKERKRQAIKQSRLFTPFTWTGSDVQNCYA